MRMCKRNKPKEFPPPPQAGGEVQGQTGLLPCPFCGRPPKAKDTKVCKALLSTEMKTVWRIKCRCGIEGHIFDSEQTAILHWNRRTSASSLSARGGKEGVGVESIEETRARHKRIAESNEGRLGLPQGTCQCEICTAPDLVEDINPPRYDVEAPERGGHCNLWQRQKPK